MLLKVVSRKKFLDVLQARGVIERGELNSTDQINVLPGNSDDIQLIWNEEDLLSNNNRDSVCVPALPQIIVVGTDRKRDFLAWVWTYLPDFRPLTAYTRVLDGKELRSFTKVKGTPVLGTLEEACLGLIVGEAATYIENRQDKKLIITPLSCASTCSHAMARALALSIEGDSDTDDQTVPTGWMKARNLTRQRQLKLKPEELALPWRVLLRIHSTEEGYQYATRDVPENIYTACLNIYKDSEVDSDIWDRLAREYPRLRDARLEMLGPRERRVVFFEQFVLSLVQSRLAESAFSSFLCGFLASQIGPGTLDYLSLLMPRLDQFPTALLWYGLCSGLQHRSSLYGFSGGLGRRILREILRKETVFDSPQGDIALAELEVLTANDTAAMEFRTGAQGVLAVEIVPLVLTTVRWPSKQVDQPELFPVETPSSDLRELMVLLDALRLRMAQVQNRISRIVDERDTPEWKAGRRQRK